MPEYGRYLQNVVFEHLETEIEFDLNPVSKSLHKGNEFYNRNAA